MKICVTGGAGYIGSHTCKALAEAGHEVVVYDNLSTGHRQFARFGPFEYGDVQDYQRLRSCLNRHKPDAVIHFAAHIDVGESVRNPGKYYRNNVVGALTLMEAMRDENVPAIVVSGTCAVYGQPQTMPISETCSYNPMSPYGRTKLAMEQMLADFAHAHHLRWTSLRYFNAAGGSPLAEIGELHTPESHLIPRVMLAAMGKLDQLEIYGGDYQTPDGTCIRDYIDVRDLASAHILAARRLLDGAPSIALNLGTGRGTSVYEIIRGVERVSEKKVPHTVQARRPGDPAMLVADASLARKILGWQPEVNMDGMLASAWNFISRHYK